MLKANVNIIFFEIMRPHVFLHDPHYIAQRPSTPPFREAVDAFGVLVAGEAEVDEPFSVKQPC